MLNKCKYCNGNDVEVSDVLELLSIAYVKCNTCHTQGPIAKNVKDAELFWNYGYVSPKDKRQPSPYS